ncbi:uncharacterized protein LOC130113027 [Lampris incognitus]|uniref:uncharacterized protein LOC130113027 n=1 Tax=Lampris incognitus TaxID=2546036 RepID=UPI0024B48036|nr:uncharacterized protein LOC130113027 [Lampris incognitus]
MTEHLRGSLYGSSLPELRLVLLGTIGCGKTASGDTILNQLSPISSPDSSRSCQVRQGISEGRRLTLVEAPRWYWYGGHMDINVRNETEQSLALAAPGPHAFLLLVPVGQFTEVEGRVPRELEEVFGEGVLRHTLVLLTCGDYLMGQTEQAYLQGEDPGLREVIERCGGRYHIINNRRREDREQVRALFEKVENIVQKNGGCYMETTQKREMEKLVKEREQELRERYKVKVAEKQEPPMESGHITNTETLRNRGGRQEYDDTNPLEKRREEEGDKMEESVSVDPRSAGLCSAAASESPSYAELQNDSAPQATKSSSFRVNSGGNPIPVVSHNSTLLCQWVTSPNISSFGNLHLVSSTKLQIFSSSFSVHHSVNSFEEQISPGASPTVLSPRSSIFSSCSSSPELRLVLLGRSGAGKSAAGNSILGQEAFTSCPDSLTSVTLECEKKRAVVAGRKMAVVDTPDWFNSERTPGEVRAQISSCIALSTPGPHSFLLCIPIDQPAKMEMQALGALEAVFGPEAVRTHTLVLFTHADQLRASGKVVQGSVEAYIASQRGDLLKLVEKCGDRFHILERGEGEDERRNVEELLEKVEQAVREGGGQCYSCPAFQEAENRVRQRQMEIAKERRGNSEQERVEVDRHFGAKTWLHHPTMPRLLEAEEEEEEEVREHEMEEARDEAERNVSTMNLESLAPISPSTLSPSLIRSMMEKLSSGAKMLPKMLADSSVWVGEGAKTVATSPMWEKVGKGTKSVQKMVADSSAWKKLGANVPKVMTDNSQWVGSGAKRVASSPMWETVGSGAKSGAKLVADSSMWVGSGAKALAQSPMWGKVGSRAKSGVKIMADRSAWVGSGIGSGAKNVAQSPMWGKVGSGAKAGVKMVAESSTWEKIRTGAEKVPKVVIVGAVLGLVLGVFFGGVIGGAVGGAAGSLISEVGRRKLSKTPTREELGDAATDAGKTVEKGVASLVRGGEKMLKAE